MNARRLKPAQPYRQFVEGRWNPALVQIALQSAETSGRAHDWINYLDIRLAILGVTLPEWRHIANQYNVLKLKSPKLFLKLVNLILLPGQFPELSDSEKYSCIRSLYKTTNHASLRATFDALHSGYLGTRISHYPKLLSHSDSELEKLIPLGRRHADAQRKAMQLEALANSFETSIMHALPGRADEARKSTPVKVAVVGNSPTILDDDKGCEIDAADLIIRFNNVSAQHNKCIHTGRRTDIWVMSPSTPITQCPNDAKSIIVSGIHALTRATFFWQTLPDMGKPLSELPTPVWHDLVSRLQAPPSAGILVLASLQSLALELDITCYGFTRNYTDHSSLPNHHADNNARSSRHNWQAEANWLADRFPETEVFAISR